MNQGPDIKMNSCKLIELLQKEKNEMRCEIVNLLNHEMKIVYLFISSFLATSGSLYIWKKDILKNMNDSGLMEIIIFLLSQLSWFFAVLLIAVVSQMATYSGYVRAIEYKQNTMLKQNLFIWEHDLAQNFFYTRKGNYFWSVSSIVLSVIILFVIFMFINLKQENFFLFGVILIELTICIVLLIRLSTESNRVYDYTLSKFKADHR